MLMAFLREEITVTFWNMFLIVVFIISKLIATVRSTSKVLQSRFRTWFDELVSLNLLTQVDCSNISKFIYRMWIVILIFKYIKNFVYCYFNLNVHFVYLFPKNAQIFWSKTLLVIVFKKNFHSFLMYFKYF